MFKLSIITINLNNVVGLQRTMNSVLSQTNCDFEYIIIDGGSNDGSVEVIKSFTDIPKGIYKEVNKEDSMRYTPYSMPITYWISEPDQGIYCAMNKGIGVSTGEYLHFLNSGDWLVNNRVVDNIMKELFPPSPDKKEIQLDILVGNVISIRSDGKIRYNMNTSSLSLFTFYHGTIQHTSAFIRRSLFDKFGLYDESLKIVADWKWYLIVVCLNNVKVHFTKNYVTFFNTYGISNTNKSILNYERRKILEELIPPLILHDYDKYFFDITQMERIKKYQLIYSIVYLTERLLFKYDKWKNKYFDWKRVKNIMNLNPNNN